MPIIIDIKQAQKLQRKKKLRKVPPIKSPVKAERFLKQRTEQLWEQVINPSLERIKRAVQQGMGQEQLAELLDAELKQAVWMYDVEADEIVDMWRLAVDKLTRVKMNAALSKSLGIDISAMLDEPEIAQALAIGGFEAAALIKTMPSKAIGQVADAVMKNMRGIPLPEDRSLMQQIEFLGARSKKWSKLIARDQTAKLTSVLNQARQQSIGVEMYIWRTVKDQRVVGNPVGNYPEGNDKHGNHYKMEGVYCKWDDPSVFSADEGSTWSKRTSDMPHNHVGMDIQCRCYSEPVLDLDSIIESAVVQ